MIRILLAALVTAAIPAAETAQAADGSAGQAARAQKILDAAGLSGGLVVHLGCGTGRLTAALRNNDHVLVHGLDRDAEKIQQARSYLDQQGLSGPVSVERLVGPRLPYADNLVNLVVLDDPSLVAPEEIDRVLAPGGKLVTLADRQPASIQRVKPWPEEVDQWTHFLHDASGNAVAHDARVAPPGRVQWIAAPRHTRSHEHIPSLYALVSAGGRIFYIADQGPIASIRQPAQWQLVARDAFNGLLLWKRPVESWFPHIVNWGQTPRQLQRRLVAGGDRVYVTLGLHAPLTAVDAASGKTVRVYEGTEGAEEIVWHQGVLLVVVRQVTPARTAERARWQTLVRQVPSPLDDRDSAQPLVRQLRRIESEAPAAVMARDADSGRLLWKQDAAGLRAVTLAAAGDRAFYQLGKDVVCVDLKTGRRRWSAATPPFWLASQDVVVCADGQTVTVLEAEDGQRRWTQKPLLCNIRDAFIAGGSLWLGGFKPIQGKRSPAWGPYFATQRDLETGEVLLHVEPENPGHHHRCYRNKATDRYILGGRRGTEFIDLKTGDVLWNSWARGTCKYGVMPACGLLYVPPHACGCYVAAKLIGFHALAPRPAGTGLPEAGEGAPRLHQGPATTRDPAPAAETPPQADWPTYRHDAERSGATATAVPATLRPRWQAALGTRLTSPTAAGGRVLVASVDQHRLHALDPDSGRPLWEFTAGGRIDSPPTLDRGRVLFGSRDGHVYCLRGSDGQLAWRLRAARRDRRIVARGQLESVAPVPGSVLVHQGVAYVTAGRSSYLDGGIDLLRIEPATGRLLSVTPVYSPDPKTGRQPPQFGPNAMPGARADILSADHTRVYLRDAPFTLHGKPDEQTRPHLFTLTDFLDDSWPHRSYWIFGTRCSLSTGCSGRDKNLIYGRLLCFNQSTIFGYGRRQVHWSNQLQDGPYRVFAVRRSDGSTLWEKAVPVQARAMVLAGDHLFLAGLPADAPRPWPQPAADQPGQLVALDATDGTQRSGCRLDAPPVFDGMAAAYGQLFVTLENGYALCLHQP